MITFTMSGIKYLVQKRVAGALALLKKMMQWLNGGDKRWPQEKELTPKWTQEEILLNKTRFKKLIEGLG